MINQRKINYLKNKLNEPIVDLILENDVDKLSNVVNIDNINDIVNDKYGFTVLHIAIVLHANNIINYLISLGADIYFENKYGLNSFELAYRYNNEYFLQFIQMN